MGKLITALKRLPKRTSALVAIVAAAIVVPAGLFAWGPGRATFTEQNPAPYITFNSITNNSFYGDERNFVTIKDASNTQDGGWTDKVTVQPGKEYVVRMYVHNNAADNLNLVATNVRASASISTTTGKNVPISGFVNADNANPTQVWDDVELTSDKDFNLAYVPGSATWHNNSVGSAPAGAKLSDSITTSAGALLGYDKLDGKIPGCYKYSGYVYFKVKPQFGDNPDFTMSKYVSKHGENKWVDNYQAQAGETVDYLINYKNTGDVQQDNVAMKDTLPQGMTYVAGSSVLGNALNPSGIKTNDGVTTTGLDIGSYKPGGNAWFIFSAKAPAEKDLACGTNTLKNVARVTASGYYKEDDANVTVPKECKPECKYSCDSLTVTKVDRTHFKFDTKYTLQNVTLKKLEYVIRDEAGKEIARQTSADYTTDKVGKYTVEAVLTVNVNGKDEVVTSPNCKKPFEVTEEPKTPVYTCDSLNFTKISRSEYSFTGAATAKDGATIVSYSFDFGDQTAPAVVTNPSDVKHTYAKDGTYTVKLSVKVTVNGQEKTVTGEKCEKKIIVTPEECKPGIPVGDDRCKEECKPGIPVGDERCKEKPECKPGIPVGDERCTEKPECKPGIPMGDARCEDKPEYCPLPGKQHLPKNSSDCKETPVETPKELPKTGSGDGIVAIFGAGALIAAIGSYIASRRALGA